MSPLVAGPADTKEPTLNAVNMTPVGSLLTASGVSDDIKTAFVYDASMGCVRKRA